jgi:hypothetical protein
MIKFFRKIRYDLMEKNKTGKYFKYAIGEIILVVIGILIALWINNVNQKRIKQQKIDVILVEIQNDLLQDMNTGNYLIWSYVRKDSIADRIIGGNLTREEMEKIPIYGAYGSESVTVWYPRYRMQNNGYNQLMNVSDDLPKKYKKLLSDLNLQHNNRQNSFSQKTEAFAIVSSNYITYLVNNQNWEALDTYNNTRSDAQIEYMLNNPIFKNQISANLKAIKDVFIEYRDYRNSIPRLYILINALLGENARPLPKEIRKTSLANENDAAPLIGTYTLKFGPENTSMGKQIEISHKNKALLLKTEKDSTLEPLMYLQADGPLFIREYEIDILRFKHNGENTLKIINPYGGQTEWVKVINE